MLVECDEPPLDIMPMVYTNPKYWIWDNIEILCFIGVLHPSQANNEFLKQYWGLDDEMQGVMP